VKADYRRYSDTELFAAFAHAPEEKRAAFEEIYSRYANRVFAFCLRLSLNRDDADDMFQEALTRFYNHTWQQERVGNILSYLLTSARNIYLNSRRGSERMSSLTEESGAVSLPQYETDELVNMIGSALELLELPYREAFVLRFYQGLSYREMAEITGDSIAALKVRVMRAKDQLRTVLAPYIQDLTRQ
jgi:RNA polymerase sigma-70 factor, ECF subfamily